MTMHQAPARTHVNGHPFYATTLSDGRDIFYFNDRTHPHTPQPGPDNREPFNRNHTPEMRRDPLTGEWISIAWQRNERAYLPSADQCPLCPQTEDNQSEVPGPFDVAVFENRNPSFGPQTTLTQKDEVTPPHFGARHNAVGRCEVVVFSPEHHGSLGCQTPERIHTVYSAWQHRTDDLLALPGVHTVFPFENRGQEIGVTLHHPHGQIYAYPFITPTLNRVLESSRRHGDGFFHELLDFEKQSSRVLYHGDSVTAFVPFAAKWPLEVMVLPHRDVGLLTELTADEVDELVHVHRKILSSFDSVYQSETPYIQAWYQAPKGVTGSEMRLHMKVTSSKRSADKLKYLAGSESAMGAFISDVLPETQADTLRNHMQ